MFCLFTPFRNLIATTGKIVEKSSGLIRTKFYRQSTSTLFQVGRFCSWVTIFQFTIYII